MNPLYASLFAILLIPGIMLLLFAVQLLLAWPLKWAWNYVIPGLFHLPALDYWHSFALLIVAMLLVKGASSSSSSK